MVAVLVDDTTLVWVKVCMEGWMTMVVAGSSVCFGAVWMVVVTGAQVPHGRFWHMMRIVRA